MQFEINGTTMQALSIQLQPGETVYTESGAMAWMSESIDMDAAKECF